MKKWLILSVFSVLLILLIGCSNDALVITKQERLTEQPITYAKLLDVEEIESKNAKLTEKDKKDKQTTNKARKKKQLASGKELQMADGKLQDEEVQKMMMYMFDEVLELTRKSADSRNDWITENRDRAIHEESTKLQKALSKYIVRDFTYDLAAEFLEYLNCECDAQLPFYSTDLLTRFEVMEQTDDSILVESITLGDGVLHGTSYGRWFLKQEDNVWKLDDYEYINYDETHDFKITFEDIENSFYVYDKKDEIIPVEFVEYFEANSVRYLVIRYPEKYLNVEYDNEPYRVINTFTASLEDSITREYNEEHQ